MGASTPGGDTFDSAASDAEADAGSAGPRAVACPDTLYAQAAARSMGVTVDGGYAAALLQRDTIAAATAAAAAETESKEDAVVCERMVVPASLVNRIFSVYGSDHHRATARAHAGTGSAPAARGSTSQQQQQQQQQQLPPELAAASAALARVRRLQAHCSGGGAGFSAVSCSPGFAAPNMALSSSCGTARSGSGPAVTAASARDSSSGRSPSAILMLALLWRVFYTQHATSLTTTTAVTKSKPVYFAHAAGAEASVAASALSQPDSAAAAAERFASLPRARDGSFTAGAGTGPMSYGPGSYAQPQSYAPQSYAPQSYAAPFPGPQSPQSFFPPSHAVPGSVVDPVPSAAVPIGASATAGAAGGSALPNSSSGGGIGHPLHHSHSHNNSMSMGNNNSAGASAAPVGGFSSVSRDSGSHSGMPFATAASPAFAHWPGAASPAPMGGAFPGSMSQRNGPAPGSASGGAQWSALALPPHQQQFQQQYQQYQQGTTASQAPSQYHGHAAQSASSFTPTGAGSAGALMGASTAPGDGAFYHGAPPFMSATAMTASDAAPVVGFCRVRTRTRMVLPRPRVVVAVSATKPLLYVGHALHTHTLTTVASTIEPVVLTAANANAAAPAANAATAAQGKLASAKSKTKTFVQALFGLRSSSSASDAQNAAAAQAAAAAISAALAALPPAVVLGELLPLLPAPALSRVTLRLIACASTRALAATAAIAPPPAAALPAGASPAAASAAFAAVGAQAATVTLADVLSGVTAVAPLSALPWWVAQLSPYFAQPSAASAAAGGAGAGAVVLPTLTVMDFAGHTLTPHAAADAEAASTDIAAAAAGAAPSASASSAAAAAAAASQRTGLVGATTASSGLLRVPAPHMAAAAPANQQPGAPGASGSGAGVGAGAGSGSSSSASATAAVSASALVAALDGVQSQWRAVYEAVLALATTRAREGHSASSPASASAFGGAGQPAATDSGCTSGGGGCCGGSACEDCAFLELLARIGLPPLPWASPSPASAELTPWCPPWAAAHDRVTVSGVTALAVHPHANIVATAVTNVAATGQTQAGHIVLSLQLT